MDRTYPVIRLNSPGLSDVICAELKPLLWGMSVVNLIFQHGCEKRELSITKNLAGFGPFGTGLSTGDVRLPRYSQVSIPSQRDSICL